MSLLESVDVVAQTMKKTKEEWVSHNPESTDIAFYVHFFRDGRLAVAVQCQLDRDIGYETATVGATGFNADEVILTFEGYHTKLPKSPVTGEDWAHQEMQFLMETRYQECVENGWVYECLNTVGGDREKRFVLHSQSYAIVDHQLVWKDSQIHDTNEEFKAEGLGVDMINRAMSYPKVIDMMIGKLGGIRELADALGQERSLFHSDMACASSLIEKKLIVGIVFCAEAGSEREQLVSERLENPGNLPTDMILLDVHKPANG